VKSPKLALWCSGCTLIARDTELASAIQIIATHECAGRIFYAREHIYVDAVAALIEEAAEMLGAPS
jgi:hypothetical protein